MLLVVAVQRCGRIVARRFPSGFSFGSVYSLPSRVLGRGPNADRALFIEMASVIRILLYVHSPPLEQLSISIKFLETNVDEVSLPVVMVS